MPVDFKWVTEKRKSRRGNNCLKFEVSNHPLKPLLAIKQSPSKKVINDINKWSSAFEEMDPLLRFEKMDLKEENFDNNFNDTINYSKAWQAKRMSILNKYTTGEKLTILSSFLPDGEKALIRQVSNLNEKVKYRLEQLDDIDENSVKKTMGLSQQEFVSKINMLGDEIKKAWDSEQRVKAFKIAIQCSKLLSDLSVMSFYPSKFILIIDILETFGNLVFDRLKEKSFGIDNAKTISEFDSKDVPEAAQETCQNWIFKMASIRELLPRMYLEISLLKCYMFLSNKEIKPAIARLTKMTRGIGNPLVATYLRFYLCYITSKIFGEKSNPFYYANLKEFLEEYKQILHPSMQNKYETQLLTLEKYLSLYTPAVEWMLFGTINPNNSSSGLCDELLQQCKNIPNNELLLLCLVREFDSKSIVHNSSEILHIIQESADKMVMVPEILCCTGEHMCSAHSFSQLASESLIQMWWKIASSIKCTNHFLQVLEPWLQFACMHLSRQHVNIILRGTIRYIVKCGKPADEFSGNFHFVIKRMLKAIPDVEELFLMDTFMPLVELVQTSNARTLIAKTVVSMFFARYQRQRIEDHVVISSLMRLCCILHESINAVTVEDEAKLCAELISKLVTAVALEELELQLNFYVECRAAFIKLDPVLVALVQAVNTLSTRIDCSKGKWLQRACAAYCFVTIPSLRCSLTKAHLYLLSGQVALLNNCIGQAEASFKVLVGLIPDVPEYILEDGQKKPTSLRLGAILSDFLSTLLLLPDNVDSNCKAYILSGFIKTMEQIHWRKTDPLYYSTLLKVLYLLNEMTQETYPYHIDMVISNDKLYGSEEEFIKTLDGYATNICQELLVVLKALGDAKETKKQHVLVIELFWVVVRRGDLKENSMRNLASNLWRLAQRQQDCDARVMNSILSSLELESNDCTKKILHELKENF